MSHILVYCPTYCHYAPPTHPKDPRIAPNSTPSHPHPQFFGPFYRGSDFRLTQQLTALPLEQARVHLARLYTLHRCRTAAVPTGRQKRLGATPPCCRKSIFFSHDFIFMNFGHFSPTIQKNNNKSDGESNSNLARPLALFGRYKQLAFSCRTTRKDSSKTCGHHIAEIRMENRISCWNEAISTGADLRPLCHVCLVNGSRSKSNRGHLY